MKKTERNLNSQYNWENLKKQIEDSPNYLKPQVIHVSLPQVEHHKICKSYYDGIEPVRNTDK